jgi:hypothetical protein
MKLDLVGFLFKEKLLIKTTFLITQVKKKISTTTRTLHTHPEKASDSEQRRFLQLDRFMFFAIKHACIKLSNAIRRYKTQGFPLIHNL